MTDVGGSGSTYASGHVVQVVSKTSSISYTTTITAHTGWSDFPANGLQIIITPKFSGSKLLLMANVTLGGTTSNNAAFRFTKNGSAIGVGDATGSRARVTAFSGWTQSADPNHLSRTVSANFLDTAGTTSAITYNIQGVTESTSLLWNRTSSYADNTLMYSGTAVSTFTIMEVAQ
jgi:hypothetical protein